MSFLTHSDPSIKAAGDLAEDLKQCGQPVEIHYKNELGIKALAIWWAVQRRHTGQYYTCGTCGGEILVKRKPGGRGFYVAHAGNSRPRPECPRPRRTGTMTVLDINDIGKDFFEVPALNGQVSLRLRKRLDEFSANPKTLLGRDRGGASSERQRRSERSLLGFLLLAIELAALNRWWPGRGYAIRFTGIMPHLRECLRRIAERGLLGGFGGKIVFPECESDFGSAVNEAMACMTCHPKLVGKAIVIGRLFDFDLGVPDTEVTLSEMKSMRLNIDQRLWNNLVFSYAKLHPAKARQTPGTETMFAAVVSNEAGKLRVVEAAWSSTNCCGILTPSAYEADILEQLITHRFTFHKCLQNRIAVGDVTMVVDYLVRTEILSANGTPFVVLEIDPNKSLERKPSKRRRDGYCKKAELSYISFDPVRNIDIRVAFPMFIGPVRPDNAKLANG